jgi:hypothetical protein
MGKVTTVTNCLCLTALRPTDIDSPKKPSLNYSSVSPTPPLKRTLSSRRGALTETGKILDDSSITKNPPPPPDKKDSGTKASSFLTLRRHNAKEAVNVAASPPRDESPKVEVSCDNLLC